MPKGHSTTFLLLVAVILFGSLLLAAQPIEIQPAGTHSASMPSTPLKTTRDVTYPSSMEAVNGSQNLGDSVQVGAWGSKDSVGNTGVQVEIRTNSYNVSSAADDAFWAGDVLSNGAFIQFGYLILPSGYYCLTGHIATNGTSCLGSDDEIGFSDARWFWAYFPSVRSLNDWYYGFGSSNSAGVNGTWHMYAISPSPLGYWMFSLDGVIMYTSSFASAPSDLPVHLVAEQASGESLTQLGPVEFRNLAYLGDDRLWHAVSSLSSIDDCGASTGAVCVNNGGYGVELVGANDVTVGSDVLPSLGVFWQRTSTCLLGNSLAGIGSAGSAPLNVTLTDSVSAAHGSVTTDWWFGNGVHLSGNSSHTVTYQTPGNYTPLVRVLDSTGCLSEASGSVYVAGSGSSGLSASGTNTSLLIDELVTSSIRLPQRDAYTPSQ